MESIFSATSHDIFLLEKISDRQKDFFRIAEDAPQQILASLQVLIIINRFCLPGMVIAKLLTSHAIVPALRP
jgi:hypothetical protein